MELVAEAADDAEAVALARTHRPDLVQMDIRMPGTDGLAATSTIYADPELDGARVLVLTTFEIDEYVAPVLRGERIPRQGRHRGRAAGRGADGGGRRVAPLPRRAPGWRHRRISPDSPPANVR